LNPIQFFAKRTVFVNLIAIFVGVVGIASYATMLRESFPSVELDYVFIGTPFPGAGPNEVEKLVTVPIELALDRVDGIKRVNSISVENLSTVVVTIDPDYGDIDKAVNAIQREVGAINDLPSDAMDPKVESLSGFWPVVIASVASESATDLEVREMAKKLKERLEEIKGVGQVTPSGLRDREIWVEADPAKLDQQALTVSQLVDAIARRNVQLPGGRLTLNGTEVLVRTSGEFERADEIPGIVVRGNDEGSKVRVADVARVSDQLQEAREIYRVNGEPAVSLWVKKKKSGDVFKVVKGVEAVLEDFRREHPAYSFSTSDDTSVYVRRRLDVTLNNAAFGFAFVAILLVLFLNPVAAIWTAVGMALSMLGGVALANVAGQTINLMTLFGFVMVLGMLVDDAVVVSENIIQKQRQGLAPLRAATEGATEVGLPVLSSVATTIAAFLPLVFMPGIMGKFLGLIPMIVIVCLLASLYESLFILPNHMAATAHWQEQGLFRRIIIWREAHLEPRIEAVIKRWSGAMRWSSGHPWKTVFGSLGLLVLTMGIAVPIVGFKLFPVGVDEFLLSWQMKVGTSLEETDKIAHRIEAVAMAMPEGEVAAVITSVGVSGENDMQARGSHRGQVRVVLAQEHLRQREGDAIADEIKDKVQGLPGVQKLEVVRRRAGPPVGKPVNVVLRGEDLGRVKQASLIVQGLLKGYEGVSDPADDMSDLRVERVVRVDERRAALAGLTVQQVAAAVRGALDGIEATKIRKGSEEVVVRVRYDHALLRDPDVLDKVKVLTPRGYRVPLKSLAKVEQGDGVMQLTRYDGKPSLIVSADLDGKVTSAKAVNDRMAKELPGALKALPDVDFKLAGENEDIQESITALLWLFLIAQLLIYIVLATQFNSFVLPGVIMLSVPFGLMGVFLTLLVHGEPMSMLAMLGAVAMTGVVVNNAILLVEFANTAFEEGMTPEEAVVEAGRRRMRAIIITSLTTIFGLLPLAYGIGGSEPFLAPMAKVMGWSISLSSIFTVFVVPAFWLVLRPFLNRGFFESLSLAPGLAFHQLPWLGRLAQRLLPLRLTALFERWYKEATRHGLYLHASDLEDLETPVRIPGGRPARKAAKA
jgi:multidrug efflux pump subunit AcrB